MVDRHAGVRTDDRDENTDDDDEAIDRRAALSDLSTHHRLLYSIIFEASEIRADEFHGRYESLEWGIDRDHDLKQVGQRARRYYLGDLRECGLIECEGNTRGRYYRVTDESPAPVLALDDFR